MDLDILAVGKAVVGGFAGGLVFRILAQVADSFIGVGVDLMTAFGFVAIFALILLEELA